MNAAVYARYSSDNQRPTSIEDQHRKCRQYLEPKGWKEVAFFSDSEISGTVARARQGYQQLLAAAKEQRFDVIVVDELSRLTRDQEELASLRKRLRFYGVGLIALADGLDTITAPGAAGPIMAIKGLINEAELEANAHRSRRGLEGRVLAGLHAGGAPHGYRTRAVHADRPGDPEGTGQAIGYEYVIHDKEAEVKRIMSVQIGRLLEVAGKTKDDRSLIDAISPHVTHRHIFDPVDALGTSVAALWYCNGDPVRTIAMAVNDRDLDDSGNLVRLRDVDCTGSVAGALAGVLNGVGAFPDDWVSDTIAANKRVYGIDLELNARRFCEVVHGN